MPQPIRTTTPARLATLFVVVAAWLWSWSIHTPWAADTAPRLWLHDLLYYLRVALVAWVLAECALWAWHPARRTWLATIALAATLLVSVAAWTYASTSLGLRLRVAASAAALQDLPRQSDGLRRQRAGLLLVDALRRPCDAATPWFWLGRPHGAGSGINLAVVRSDGLPKAPHAQAFRLRRIDAQWWVAYQNGPQYQALQGDAAAARCTRPREAASHRAGMAFVEAG